MTPSSSGQLVWTGPAGGLWSNSANWTDPVSHLHFAPSSTDQLLFGDGGTGANTSSTMDFTSLTVDRVIMDSTYNATLTIGSGHTLTTNYFQQYGTLSMTGSATVSAGTYIDIYGAVSAMSMAPFTSLLNASGSFFLFSTGSISALGPTGLAISSANFSDSGTIAAGSSSMAGSLTISGPFTQSAGTITVNGGSLLTFDSLKDPSAYPVFQSAVSMLGGATIATDTQLAISGGSLVVTGGPGANTIGGTGGSLRVYNNGTISVGVSGVSASTLSLTTGSLTVGALDPAGAATGGTLNLYTGSAVALPAAPTSSTFVVKSLGVVNMYGATIALGGVAALDIRAADPGLTAGTVNSFGAAPPSPGDTITGPISCAGIINVGNGAAVATTLTVGGALGISGTLNMKGATLARGGNAVGLSGTLNSVGGSGGLGDSITGAGTFTNTGTISFAGTLHTLTLSSAYTQGSAGTLQARVANGQVSDVFAIGGAATLAGTLTVTAYGGALNPNQVWIVMTFASFTGDFTTKNFPAPMGWIGVPVAGDYEIFN